MLTPAIDTEEVRSPCPPTASLGDGVDHNLGGKGLMTLYNRMGIFHNRQDDAQGLRAALEKCFADVDLSVIGTVAVFSARRPLR